MYKVNYKIRDIIEYYSKNNKGHKYREVNKDKLIHFSIK